MWIQYWGVKKFLHSVNFKSSLSLIKIPELIIIKINEFIKFTNLNSILGLLMFYFLYKGMLINSPNKNSNRVGK